MKYALKTDIICGESDRMSTVYGITAINMDGKVIKSISDIFLDKIEAEKFIDLCNTSNLSLEHLDDVVEDVLANT